MKYAMKVTFKLIVEANSGVDAVNKINEMDYTFSYRGVDIESSARERAPVDLVDGTLNDAIMHQQ